MGGIEVRALNSPSTRAFSFIIVRAVSIPRAVPIINTITAALAGARPVLCEKSGIKLSLTIDQNKGLLGITLPPVNPYRRKYLIYPLGPPLQKDKNPSIGTAYT